MSARPHNQKARMSNQTISRGKKVVWIVIGLIALFLGGIGVFLPILPTTPFVIVAAFAFGKSIPAWRRWLVNNKIFGPMIADWEETGAIALRYKILASFMMLSALALSFYLSMGAVIIFVQALCLLAVFAFIVSRPNGRL